MDEVLNRIPGGFFFFNDDGVLLSANLTLERLLDYEPGELRNRRIDELLAPGGRIYYQTHFFPVLKLQGRIEEVFLKLMTKAGRVVPVLANAVRTRETNGDFRNECLVLRMSERERYEDEILQAKRVAEAANDSKAKFVSMMSHELRTPLQSVLGYAELLIGGKDGPLTPAQREDIESIRQASKSLARLLDDIFNFSRLESGRAGLEITQLSVSDAIDRAEALLRPRISEAQLVYERAPIPKTVMMQADDYRLQQILLNLLVNALKFTPAGGRISISAYKENGRVGIDVADTGPGVPESDVERIFEPFVQIRPGRQHDSTSGVGLGLAISRDLARAMGGDLTVRSQEGKGSTFTLMLPAESNWVGGEFALPGKA
jgi:signal transduction histidine kinase